MTSSQHAAIKSGVLRRWLLFLFALLLVPVTAQAQNITPELVAEGPAPRGGEVELAIHMQPKPGWHGYWLNPGDAGLPMDVKWQLPTGFAAGALRYPVPTRLEIAGLMNYVYETEYAVLVRLKVPANASGIVPIRAEAHWLACTDKVCVPEQGILELDLRVGSGVPQRRQFDVWRRALARPLASAAKFELTDSKLRIAFPLPESVEVTEPYVFPAADGPVDYAAVQTFRRKGDVLIAELARRRGKPAQFAGLLALGDGRGLEFSAVTGDVPAGGLMVGGLGARAVVLAVLGAIAGGFLLNLMPCVFPILALKALHLARGGGHESEARRDALAYAGGAIVGTGGLGAVLLAIRAGGDAAGWAFQLQEPKMLLFLLLLAVGITLNLLGLFMVPAMGGRARPTGGFATGALAAFVATPCAGPFLGAALGTALLLPPLGSLAVFAALGLGLALPFVAVAFIPALRDRLPKPGPWMVKLQRYLAIPMAASAAACLWLLWRVGGLTAFEIGLVAAAVLSLCLAGAGLLQRRGKQSGYWAAMAAVAVGVAAISAMPHRSIVTERVVEGAEPWSEKAVAESLAQGHPAFVYFTADWCLTCKVNEAAAIDRDEVKKAFARSGVHLFAGDWTDGDPIITRFIEERGRAGVPLYLWYEPGKEAEELPQILTADMLISRARRRR